MFESNIKVYYEDTDAAGVVYYANYLKFIERARTDWLASLGCSHAWLKMHYQVLFVVRKVSAHYRLPAKLDQQLLLQTQLENNTKTRLVFSQKILDKNNNKVLFDAVVEVVCVHSNSFKSVVIPQDILEKLM